MATLGFHRVLGARTPSGGVVEAVSRVLGDELLVVGEWIPITSTIVPRRSTAGMLCSTAEPTPAAPTIAAAPGDPFATPGSISPLWCQWDRVLRRRPAEYDKRTDRKVVDEERHISCAATAIAPASIGGLQPRPGGHRGPDR